MVQTIADLIAQSKASAKATTTPDDSQVEKIIPPKNLLDKVSEESQDVATAFSEKIQAVNLDTWERQAQKQAQLFGLKYINLKGFPISPEVLSLVPEDVAIQTKTLCFFRLGNEIRLATTDNRPTSSQKIIDDLQKQYPQAHIAKYLTSEHSFNLALSLYKNIAKVRFIQTDIQVTEADIQRFSKELNNYGDFATKLPQVNLTDVFIMVIAMAMKVGSSDIHIEAEEKDVVIRYRVDGMLQVAAKIPATIWPRLISRIKSISGLKINVTEVPQDGRITIALTNDKMDIRVSTLPTAFGESVVMRLLKSSTVGLSFEQLGLRANSFKRLDQEVSRPDGMIVTTGPTGSGKTTTLYAILNKLNKPDTKIITLENPVEYKLAGIAQSQIDHSKGYTFAKGLRAILRQDPNVVMVGEIRDLETAETAIQAALTGHILLSTIHTNDAAGAIPRFLSMGVAPYLLAPALRAVIGQRLVRKICEHCKQPYTPSFEIAEKVKKVIVSIPPNSGETPPDFAQIKFFKGQGCDYCNKTGYKGRVGIYEVFTMNEEIEAQTLSGKISEYQMRDITQRNGMLTMAQDGILKCAEGLTTPEEVFRVADVN